MKTTSRKSSSRWSRVAWASPVLLLLVPLVAMQFTTEVNWSPADFGIFGALLLGASYAYKLASDRSGPNSYKFAMGLAVLAALLMIWINGAVGIIGNESNDANLMYFVILAIGLIGAVIVRFQPAGMVRVMWATAAAQVLVFVIAWIAGWGFTGPITIVFVALWLGAAQLFRQAAAEGAP